jgi:diamine N-acetyltransferase
MSSAVLSLSTVTQRNWEACARLEIMPTQSAFVFTAAFSLAQCAYTPALTPLAVEADGKVVGHVVVKRSEQCGWIKRVIIGRDHQGKGYGRFAVEAAIALLTDQASCAEIRLAVTPGNQSAANLYASLGFAATGEIDGDGDVVYRLQVERPSRQVKS